ncbi:MAG: STAS domain-containing protein [Acidimicrobiales bacterium]
MSVIPGAGNGMGEFRVDPVVIDGHAVLHLHGEIDYETAPRLDAALQAVERLGIPTIVLDMSGLTFIDTSGLNRMVVALKRQREQGGDVVLKSPGRQTLRVLEIVGLTRVFTITYETGVSALPRRPTAPLAAALHRKGAGQMQVGRLDPKGESKTPAS